MRIREEGLTVYGFGEKKTPEAFKSSCHKFFFTEVLRPEKDQAIESASVALPVSASKTITEEEAISFPKKLVLAALEQAGDDSGWSQLGTFGSYLTKLLPEFDPRNYGYKKLSTLVKSESTLFETEERSNQLYVRAK